MMSLLILDKLSKDYAGNEILTEVSCSIEKKQRIGLVGRNGTGKSTFLRILAGLEEPSIGQVSRLNGVIVDYLEQDPIFSAAATLYKEMLTVFKPVFMIKQKMVKIEDVLNSPEVIGNVTLLEKYLNQYGKLQIRYEMANGYTYESKIKTILFGLKFAEEDFYRKMVTFSGGERIRAAFARLLLKEPDLLLLDEPTNHLDLPAIEWLEEYLQNYRGTVVLVSHDRVFLDRVVNRIYELQDRCLEVYHGNYSAYLQQKQKRIKLQEKAYLQQQEQIEKMERFIAKFKAGTRSTQAKSVEKRLNKLDRIKRPRKPTKIMNLPFSPTSTSGQVVVRCEKLTKGFGERILFKELDLVIERGERVVITGPNGCGKSTLLNILAGELTPDYGMISFGPNVEVGYFTQHFEHLNPELTIFENIYQAKRMDRFQIHSLLGRFLFSGEDVEKKVSVLSGGEKNRVALARLIAKQPNLLLLDEPTNHLDLDSKQVLIDALKDFPGTIILISHDRYLIQELATRKLEFPIC